MKSFVLVALGATFINVGVTGIMLTLYPPTNTTTYTTVRTTQADHKVHLT